MISIVGSLSVSPVLVDRLILVRSIVHEHHVYTTELSEKDATYQQAIA